MSITISTTVDIDAPAQAVWDILTDFAAYGEWNPSMRIEGTAQAGTRLVVGMGAGGGRGSALKPTVLAAVPGRELRWVGKLGPGGIVDGEHYFVLAPNADGTTRLDHGETFSGALVALVKLFDHGTSRRATTATTTSTRPSNSAPRPFATGADGRPSLVGSRKPLRGRG
jgi:hypothetical protein